MSPPLPRAPSPRGPDAAMRRAILSSYVGEDRARHPGRGLLRRARLRWGGLGEALARLPRHGLVVDLGAGEGLLAQLLVRTSPDLAVLAVERDAGRADRARRAAAGLPVRVVHGDPTSVPLPRCDAVVLLDVLRFLDTAAQDRLLRRAVAALRPGGTLLLREVDAALTLRFFLARGRDACARTPRPRRGPSYRTAGAWAAVLRAAGLADPRFDEPGLRARRIATAAVPLREVPPADVPEA